MAKEHKATNGPRKAIIAPRIFTAILRSDGAVVKGSEITEQQAVQEREGQRDVVVCGPEPDENSEVAKRIENTANGDYVRHAKHRPLGLNHFQPMSRPPAGHTFYETKGSKARKP